MSYILNKFKKKGLYIMPKLKNISIALLALAASVCCPIFAEETPETGYEILISPAVTGRILLPIGDFGEITSLGGGLAFGAEFGNLIVPQTVLRFTAGYDFISELIESVTSFGISSITLTAGYAFPVGDSFSITPLAGGGYLGHLVSESQVNMYLDPFVRAQIDGTLDIAGDLNLVFGPFCNIFFEQSQTGIYLGFGMGISNTFHVFLGKKQPARALQFTRDLDFFSPNADGLKDVITFKQSAQGEIDRYEISITAGGGITIKTFRGASVLPRDLMWDGKTDNGKTAEDGSYTATITVISGNHEVKAACAAFTIDTKPPEVALSVKPERFSPDSDGVDDTSLISMIAKQADEVADWTIKITDPTGTPFHEQRGTGSSGMKYTWDGKSAVGEIVQSTEEYSIEAVVADKAGNRTILNGKIAVDVLVQRFGNRLKIIIPSIVFQGFEADFRRGSPEQIAKNNAVINRLVEIFRKYPNYSLLIEGYAINVYTDNQARMERENTEALLPLSQKRAEAIREALVQQGVDRTRITAVGRGNANPVVPYTDVANQWKNRRVEFILEKK